MRIDVVLEMIHIPFVDAGADVEEYPETSNNFSPNNIMQQIEQYTDGKPNRGEVRVITDNARANYVYTTDHERTFCGPYAIS